MLYNSDLRHGLEFDCNQQALLDWGAKPLMDFNLFQHDIRFIDMTGFYNGGLWENIWKHK